MTRNQALKLVAADAAASAIEKGLEYWGFVGWEDYPEIGEFDWDQVVKLAEKMAEKVRPHGQDVADARDFLASFVNPEAD